MTDSWLRMCVQSFDSWGCGSCYIIFREWNNLAHHLLLTLFSLNEFHTFLKKERTKNENKNPCYCRGSLNMCNIIIFKFCNLHIMLIIHFGKYITLKIWLLDTLKKKKKFIFYSNFMRWKIKENFMILRKILVIHGRLIYVYL